MVARLDQTVNLPAMFGARVEPTPLLRHHADPV
jgi:hypothetical protein